MKPYNAVDYYDMDSLLSEEELMIRDSIRRFVTNEVLPVIDEYYENGEFPMHLVPKLGELGILGVKLPEK